MYECVCVCVSVSGNVNECGVRSLCVVNVEYACGICIVSECVCVCVCVTCELCMQVNKHMCEHI